VARRTISISVDGTATVVSPQRSITTCVTAVVSGRISLNDVPLPASVAVSIRPPIATTSERTTSIPTPRPASSVTLVAVEKPGAKIRLASSTSVGSADPSSSPISRPLRRMRSRSRPAPSSRISTPTSLPSCESATMIEPAASLPAALRLSGDSIPCVTQLRSRCSKAPVIRSSTPRSISIEPPTMSSRTCLPVSFAACRTTR
jgi:hypothetical protein